MLPPASAVDHGIAGGGGLPARFRWFGRLPPPAFRPACVGLVSSLLSTAHGQVVTTPGGRCEPVILHTAATGVVLFYPTARTFSEAGASWRLCASHWPEASKIMNQNHPFVQIQAARHSFDDALWSYSLIMTVTWPLLDMLACHAIYLLLLRSLVCAFFIMGNSGYRAVMTDKGKMTARKVAMSTSPDAAGATAVVSGSIGDRWRRYRSAVRPAPGGLVAARNALTDAPVTMASTRW